MYCNLALIGAPNTGKTTLITSLMNHEQDLVTQTPIAWYAKSLILDGEHPIKCNLWELTSNPPPTPERFNSQILWPRVQTILLSLNLSDPTTLEHLERYYRLIQETPDTQAKPVILVGTYINASPMVNKVKVDVLNWCAELDERDILFIEVYLKDPEQILDAWDQIVQY